MIIPQNLTDRGIHGNDGMFPSHLTSGVTNDKEQVHPDVLVRVAMRNMGN